jgi:hypothetical protein
LRVGELVLVLGHPPQGGGRRPLGAGLTVGNLDAGDRAEVRRERLQRGFEGHGAVGLDARDDGLPRGLRFVRLGLVHLELAVAGEHVLGGNRRIGRGRRRRVVAGRSVAATRGQPQGRHDDAAQCQ